MKIRELGPRDLIEVDSAESIAEAAKHLSDDNIGALAVFDATGLVGIFSERDLARAIADGVDPDETQVDEYMTESPIRVTTDEYIGDAIAKMNEFGIRHLVVEDEGDVTGMISIRDLLALAGTRWPEL